ncbi:Na/Pi cotransporter family protein [Geobacter sp. SVR]|uniref:Na/Pi cotransporter family protein n=1 Tax=Geobacter sp. SVR TaxID=2495594 RepID=UPI00143F0064|nr:Na/Pi symporter [Geobacter sp. SVR]BCS54002.1 Na/Pi cotransporter II-like protein [Geobacter sp. SVR]GCF86217.1 sodium:phosphate symporter [Geobacter sp. SVR]
MSLNLLEGALGGIGLFLLGMRIMSNGIRTVADARIRAVFAAITSNRLYSLLFGMVLSFSLNSAGAAVIFTIGLANGGVLTAFQAMSVLAGALVGASLSLHLQGIPYSLVAAPLVFAGVLLKFFAHRRRLANAGDLLLGAGLLFLGLSLLEGSFRPYESHPFYGAFRGAFFNYPVPAMVFGAVISCFVQSALSATQVITSLVLSQQVPASMGNLMMLGSVAGVAAIGLLASIGGTFVSRRIAISFFLVTVVAILPLAVFAPYLADIVASSSLADMASGSLQRGELFSRLAWLHTVAGIVAALIATAASGLVSRIIGAYDDHGGNGAMPQPRAGYLDMRIINTPTLAIEQARKEIVRMVSVTGYMFADVREMLFDYDARRADTIRRHEQVLDSLNHEITGFLASLARSSTNPDISYEIPGLLQTVTDLEHIGDRCEDILDCIIDRKEASIFFSDEAMDDLRRMAAAVAENMSFVETMVKEGLTPENDARRRLKEAARAADDEIKELHFDRICSGVCPPRAAMLFNELMADLERIAELCWNLMAIYGRKSA